MPSARTKKMVAGAIATAALLPALATAPAACFPQGQCDASFVEYCAPGDASCAGHLIDPYTWESGPMKGDWMDNRHNRTWQLHLRDAITNDTLQGNVYEYLAYISPTARPLDPGGQFTLASGNLAEWSAGPDSTSIYVHNDTCADYFLYVLVHSSPGVPTSDAGDDSATGNDGASLNDGATE